MTILIVDDQDIKVNKIKTVINESAVGRNATVFVNQNVADTVEFLSKGIPVDLMILDLNMPVRHGEEVKPGAGLGVIKEIKRRRDLVRPHHVIGLTGATPVDDLSTKFFSADGWVLVDYNPALLDWEEVISNKLDWISPVTTLAIVKSRRKLLFVGASPKDQDPINLGTEQRKLLNTLQMAQNRDDFEFIARQGATFSGLSLEMISNQPEFLHLSGHGDEEGLVLEDDQGLTSYMPVEALNQLVLLTAGIKCIFLNACYSSDQAKLLSQNKLYVIGLNGTINSDVAEAFATGFYQAIYEGLTIELAYRSGVAHGIVASGTAGFSKSQLWFAGKPVN